MAKVALLAFVLATATLAVCPALAAIAQSSPSPVPIASDPITDTLELPIRPSYDLLKWTIKLQEPGTVCASAASLRASGTTVPIARLYDVHLDDAHPQE